MVRMQRFVAIVSALLILVLGGRTSYAQTKFNAWFHSNSNVINFVARPHPGVAILTLGQTPDTATASTAINAGYAVMEGIGGGGGTGQSTADYINGWTCSGGKCTQTTPNLSIVTKG